LEGLAFDDAGEIQRIYVDSNWHGKGVAQQLFEACLHAFDKRDINRIWLGVWEHNPRAIAFYKKYGFKEAGEKSFLLGSDRQRDIVMIHELSGDRA